MKDKNEFARESVVEDYLTDLLTEPHAESTFDNTIKGMQGLLLWLSDSILEEQ